MRAGPIGLDFGPGSVERVEVSRMTRAVEAGLIVAALFVLLMVMAWLMMVGPAYPQVTTHRWRDCHQNARRETVCRECWLEGGKRFCTKTRVMVRL